MRWYMFVRDSVVAEPPPELLLPGAVDGAAGVLLIFPPLFWCVEEKSDSGCRDSNPGSERS